VFIQFYQRLNQYLSNKSNGFIFLKRACGNQRHCEGVNTSFGGRADVADKS
jgi:hypothetical protein